MKNTTTYIVKETNKYNVTRNTYICTTDFEKAKMVFNTKKARAYDTEIVLADTDGNVYERKGFVNTRNTYTNKGVRNGYINVGYITR